MSSDTNKKVFHFKYISKKLDMLMRIVAKIVLLVSSVYAVLPYSPAVDPLAVDPLLGYGPRAAARRAAALGAGYPYLP